MRAVTTAAAALHLIFKFNVGALCKQANLHRLHFWKNFNRHFYANAFFKSFDKSFAVSVGNYGRWHARKQPDIFTGKEAGISTYILVYDLQIKLAINVNALILR